MRFTMGFGGGMKAMTSPDAQRGPAPTLPTGQKPSSVRNHLQFRQAHKKPLAGRTEVTLPPLEILATRVILNPVIVIRIFAGFSTTTHP
jgi:hypothetical protein